MTVLSAKLIIEGQDATGSAFKAVEQKIDKIAKAADSASRVSKTVGNISSKVDAAANAFGTVSLAVERAEHRVNSLSRALHGVGQTVQDVGAMMGAALGYKAIQAIEGSIKAAAHY